MRGREGMVYAGATPSPRKRVALHLAPPMSSLRFWPTASYDMAGLERFERSSESESPARKVRYSRTRGRRRWPEQGEVQAADSGMPWRAAQSVVYGF